MPRQILLYYPMYSYTIADVMTQMEAMKEEDIVVRVNTPGGEVYYAYGLFAKFQEHSKGKKIQVDGTADSCGAFLCCYAKKEEVECLDVSTFTFHRAAYPSWYESNPDYFTEEARASLERMNKNLRTALENRIDTEKFAQLTGVTIDQLFSMDSRIDVELSAQDAKKIGLVNKIIPITPAKKEEVEALTLQIAAKTSGILLPTPAPEATIENDPQNNNMTITTVAQLLAQYPELCAQIQKDAVTAERDRVGAYLAFLDVAPEEVAKGIKEGTPMSQTQMVELTRKSMSIEKVAEVKEDNPQAITTQEPKTPKAEGDKAMGDFLAAAKKNRETAS